MNKDTIREYIYAGKTIILRDSEPEKPIVNSVIEDFETYSEDSTKITITGIDYIGRVITFSNASKIVFVNTKAKVVLL